MTSNITVHRHKAMMSIMITHVQGWVALVLLKWIVERQSARCVRCVQTSQYAVW